MSVGVPTLHQVRGRQGATGFDITVELKDQEFSNQLKFSIQ
jgi:hypothetical protein